MKAVLFLIGLVIVVVGAAAGNNVHLVAQDSDITGACGTPFSPMQIESLMHEDEINAVARGRRTNLESLCFEKVRIWQVVSWGLCGLGVAIAMGIVVASVGVAGRVALAGVAIVLGVGAAALLVERNARYPDPETTLPSATTRSTSPTPSYSPFTQSGAAAASPTTAAAPDAAAVVGSGCYAGSKPAVDVDGVRVYCARMESSDSFVWSRIPGVLAMPQYGDWQTTVCVQQTGRNAADCAAEIARAVNWGDGTPPP
ncbi:hypothetical protein [Mycobacterium avium]|uniref:Uncharacterized protein n=1 Tax=Mycobacterium avium subsp. hominissuis TaxID=439334 RepID=A0AAI8SNI7_MYCAV|nr:hypothetical protein [Mycobacterium avium]MBZ4511784.1 hypothetical protein [Mycobacterium avium subsp. hominissuis]MBZ4574927.1 hypothetical protein [Mycobacterium avium subsp. hominissuis]QBC85456.1 hypothetical protein B6K05_012635 [Mycobacterium avium subsp. hominissuis]QCR72861.1 hypothetical protein FCV17_14610 [Mycobacterium avium subsp. hominissuis]QCR76152.1 hypothetical protein FCV16_07155 [Mycobacterium avium subsp. hominissuis]